ncbi:hypothetical protein N7457_004962 [Penicillium paradoxum]|uniref:uncharacterized protein n=1 Tax=Penicillium paradoxum TaxID=176176 RepID=UPI002548B7D4|nr:uncharacterized protein N7457_004962 [Penicillium paradoxum]KAJ5783188.1 hypothetical protein N7457_004962 [Penicillium paradoxum]
MAANQPAMAINEILARKPQGYHRLANVMSKDAGFAIFRNFNEINIINLLSLQAEINDLRNKFEFLHRLDDASSNTTRQQFSKRLLLLQRSKGDEGQQHDLLLQLRKKMKDYINTINSIARPRKSHLALLQDWLQDSKGGDNFQKGTENQLWDEPDPSAYLTLWAPTGEMDIFSRGITRLAVGIFHRTWGEKHGLGKIVDEESGLISYDDSRVNMASTVLATFPLAIPFELLMRRVAPGPVKTDIVLDMQELQEIAERIWAV